MKQTFFDFGLIDSQQLREFREFLFQSGYTSKKITTALKELPPAFKQGSRQEAIYRYLFGKNPRLFQLLQLFLSDVVMSKSELVELFGSRLFKFLVKIGLLEKKKFNAYFSPVFIFPFADLYIVTDPFGDIISDDAFNVVFQLNKEQNVFANALIPHSCDKALDLCTGSGVFALLASNYAKQVTAVDINPRAVNFAKFNALLNGRSNVRVLQGDLFEMLSGETFDVILANPPYNPSFEPQVQEKLCIHAGKSGEDILFKIIQNVPKFLNQGGICQIVSRYFYKEGLNYYDRVKELIDVNPFDVCMLQSHPRQIFSMTNLLKTSWSVGGSQLNALFNFYRAEKIDRESYGVLNFHRIEGPGRYIEKNVDFEFHLDAPMSHLISDEFQPKASNG